MKKRLCCIIAMLSAATMLSGCAGKESPSSSSDASSKAEETTTTVTTAAPVVTLPTTTKQVINETPASYESFGIDAAKKQEFISKTAKSCEIPVISITTKDDESITSREIYTSCVVDVFNCDESMEINEASAGIKVRGNSSAYYGDVSQILQNTVPYRIKFDSKTNMLGLHGGEQFKNWVLLKSDWDLIRNDIAFRMGRAIMGEDNFCSDSQLVHLYVNEKFQGIYLLCEQNQINKNRVDVTEPEEGYTGTDIGYYLELDNYATSEENNHYISMDYNGAEVTDIEGETRQFVPAEYSIKNDLYSQNQIDFIEKYMNDLFTIIYEATEKGNYLAFDENFELTASEYDNAKDTISAVCDLDSIVDMYILYEIIHDYDCGEGSFFMCVDFSENSRYPKLTFTSPWDFNWAYSDDAEGRYYAGAFCDQSFANQNGDRSNPWFILLMKQDWFVDMVKEKWTAMNKEGVLKNCIKEEEAYLKKYNKDLNKVDEWATDCSADLIYWIQCRIYWLNDEWLIK